MTEDSKIPKIFPDDVVLTKIYLIRDHKVMIDKDLAELYRIETKRLKEAVRRNRKRFPEDFMFEMSKEELENWRTQLRRIRNTLDKSSLPPNLLRRVHQGRLPCLAENCDQNQRGKNQQGKKKGTGLNVNTMGEVLQPVCTEKVSQR